MCVARICYKLCLSTSPLHQPDVLPHFLIFFTSSYGLSREQLEDLNFRIKSSDLFEYRPSTRRGPMKTPENPVGRQQQNDLPYTFNVFPGIPPPTALLHNPMLAEVFGAGFTKAPRSKVSSGSNTSNTVGSY